MAIGEDNLEQGDSQRGISLLVIHQHQHHLRTYQKCKILSSHTRNTESEFLGPALCVSRNSLGMSLRITSVVARPRRQLVSIYLAYVGEGESPNISTQQQGYNKERLSFFFCKMVLIISMRIVRVWDNGFKASSSSAHHLQRGKPNMLIFQRW